MSTETVAAPPLPKPVAAEPGLSQIARVADTFLAPTQTFADIRRNTSWWLPFLILVLGSLASGYTVQRQVGFERAFLNHLHTTPAQEEQMNQLPPEQKAARVAVSARVTQSITFAFPILLAVGFALYSLILWAGFNFILGAETTYAQVYAVSWYAALPYILITILSIITLFFGGNAENYDYANPIGTNLAYYMPDASPGLKAFLGAFDVIKLWSLALQVVGMAVIARKTILLSAIIVVGWWLITVIVTTGLAAAFS